MSIDNQLLFCYLEEDNIQQAYFRVRPLLTPDADIRQYSSDHADAISRILALL